MALQPHEKQVCDLLIRSEWIDNVIIKDGEAVLMFRQGETPLENGKLKLWLFSRLHRELIGAGLASPEHWHILLQMGLGLGEHEGWEVFPESQ